MVSLKICDGSFSYNNHKIFKSINLELNGGEVLCVLGPNGCGKSTFLKAILGLQDGFFGQVFLDGVDLIQNKFMGIWNKAAYVPQSKKPVFGFTAYEMVEMGRNNHLGKTGEPGEKDRQIVLNAMEMCGILSLKDKPCNKMSGGEFQLVMIARALATEPEILVLDEPESNLDLKNQSMIMDLLKKLADKNLLILMATHSLESAMETGNKVLFLGKDCTSLYGNARELITQTNIQKFFGVKPHQVQFPE